MRSLRVVPAPTGPSRLALSLLLVLASVGTPLIAGCARNADFEIELTIPPRPATGPALYAVAMFLTGDVEFANVAIDAEYPGTLLGATQQQLRFSVLTERSDGRLRMVVFFCESTTCADEDPSTIPQAWFDFERATYIGHRTRWSGEILDVPASLPAAATCVDRCEVEGCIEGMGWFCRDDGTHYCQERGAPVGEEICTR